jgi:UPF0271 protein
MKINCDLGESFGSWCKGQDELVMPLIDQANIACGFHAGDPQIMGNTVKLAIENNVEIGAHPGYPDLIGFGRRPYSCDLLELRSILLYQIGALQAMCCSLGTKVSYVKPHGALYHSMMKNEEVMKCILQTISSLPFELSLMVQASTEHRKYMDIASSLGVKLISEAFADRSYIDHNNLAGRGILNAVKVDSNEIYLNIKNMKSNHQVVSVSGEVIDMKIDTICLHGDNESSLLALEKLYREGL